MSACLAELAASLGAPQPAVAAAVFSRWTSLVGREVAAHTTPLSLRDGVLVVAVDQPAWAVQLRFLANELVGRLREATGSDEVRELRFSVSLSLGNGDRRAGRA